MRMPPAGERLRFPEGAKKMIFWKAHEPAYKDRIQPRLGPAGPKSAPDGPPMRGNQRGPQRAPDRAQLRECRTMRRCQMGRAGKALFGQVVQDVHP